MPTAIKCIVHDKRVIDVLRALKPYALDPPVVDPIDDQPNGIAKKIASSGSLTRMVSDIVAKAAKAGKKTISSREIKQALVALGGNPGSYSYGLKVLLETKKIKRTKTTSVYEVVK
jgi:hypothetical protein